MNRNAIINHIDLWASKLGSYNAVAQKCGINAGALSTIRTGKYGANEQRMLQKIANELGYRDEKWNLVRSIGNYRRVEQVVSDAKSESMWFCISNKAGGGKTAPLEDIFNKDTTGTVFYIQCEEWNARQFLAKLIGKTLGESFLTGGYKTIAQMTDLLVNFFNGMSLDYPVLLIDEGDKLKSPAVRFLIPLFNRTEGRLGLIYSGSENLEKEIKAGVRLRKKGYDELESRLGRTYINLKGITEKETLEICKANGIVSDEMCLSIWGELPKVDKPTTVRVPNSTTTKTVMVKYVEDLRLLKRIIQREQLMMRRKGGNE